MRKISTPYNFSFKVFPILFYGFLTVFISIVWMGGGLTKAPLFLIVPIVMAIVGFFFMRVAFGELVDEVFDCGNHLLVRKGSIEERVSFANIINVNFAMNQRPARIALTLAKPGKLGARITFAPPPRLYLSPLPESELAEELIVRAHEARKHAGG